VVILFADILFVDTPSADILFVDTLFADILSEAGAPDAPPYFLAILIRLPEAHSGAATKKRFGSLR
jgi:hypothetical protein